MNEELIQPTSPLLKASGLIKTYQKRPVVQNLSLTLYPGEVVGLLGPNGAGKTTAFYLITGLVKPDAGEILFEGKDITYLPIYKRARLGIGYLAQEPSIFRNLTVEDNLLAILETLPLSRAERLDQLTSLLEELHLTSLRKKKALLLSGGERRRLEITRALITTPKLLLLDEPFANIDPLAIQEVKQLIQILKAKGISVLICDHNAREIFSTVDRSYLLQEGRVLLSGTVDELLASSEARRSYLGEEFRM